MVLNNSGPISIGGSIVGQSINLELGRSASSQSSLNETALRTLAGKFTGAINLSDFYGKYKIWNYFGHVSRPFLTAGFKQTIQSNGDIISAGYFGDNGKGYLFKFDRDGRPIWRRILSVASNNLILFSGCISDSNNNIYSAGGVGSAIVLLKHDQNGNLVWQYTYSQLNIDVQNVRITTDAAGNIFVATLAYDPSTYTRSINVLKIDTNGNIVWQKKIQTSYTEPRLENIHCAADGSIYITGKLPSFFGGGHPWLLKLNSSGAQVWSKLLYDNRYPVGDLSNYGAIQSVYIDSFNNVYCFGIFSTTSITPNPYAALGIWKFSSNGTLLWQKGLGSFQFGLGGRFVGLDSNGNLCFIAKTDTADLSNQYPTGLMDAILISKIDSNGAILSQNIFTPKINSYPKNTISTFDGLIVSEYRYGLNLYGTFGGFNRNDQNQIVNYYCGLFNVNLNLAPDIDVSYLQYLPSNYPLLSTTGLADTTVTSTITNSSYTRGNITVTQISLTDNSDVVTYYIS